MAKYLLHYFITIALIGIFSDVIAQAPVISYTPATNVYSVGTAITPLTPTGGPVSSVGFGAATALTGATLNNPRGVAIDASGNIYVTNSGNNTISKYNSSGTYLGTFGSGATMSFPKEVVFDSSGNAYVLNLGASAGTGSVYKYNSSGVYQSTILSGLNYALGMTIDASDNIYIADQGAVTVKKYSTSGTLLLSLPTANLSTPLGVTTDASGNIYVLNNGAGNVTKYNSTGTYLSTILSGYTSAQAITTDRAGNIYVGDNSAINTVYVYNQSGTLLTSKAVSDPEGIAVDTKGDLFTAGYYTNQMNQYKPTGGYFLSGTLPAGLNFDSTTGQISGTPMTTKAATVYTVTAYNATGSGSATVSITVNNPTYGNYAFQDLITLNTTSLGITSNLTNFPALLSIQDNNLIISNTCTDKVQNPNGPNYDFAFVSGGSELYYQIESYNQTTGTLLVWVQVPTLTYATNNTISFYFGSKSPTVTHNTAFFANTWASNYLAVFHFNEASYTGSMTDGTAGGHTGTASGMTSADLVAGKIGTAYSFNGSSKKITSNAVSVTGPFTISAWVKLGATGLDQKVMTNQSAAGGSSGGYKLGVFTNNIPEAESGVALNRGSTPAPAAFTTGTWHYLQGVYTGSTLSTYVDGVKYEILTTSNNPSANASFYIGVGEGGAGYYFNGVIDEPRVSNVAKTSDWIKAEYIDQNNPTAFTSIGATTTNTTNAAAIAGSLTYTWTGATSTDPATATNWNNTTSGTNNQLPAFDGSATLVIPAGLSNYPVLTANISLYGLTIASGASLNLNGYSLSVACNIYNSSTGQILYGGNNASGITWNGSLATQSYNGANTSNTASVGQMTINNSAGGTVTINGGPVDIYNALTLAKGNLAVGASPAALTLKSTATQSASVSAIPAGSTITGTVNVQRYISARRGYRLLSSPVYAATVNSVPVYSINYLGNTLWLTGTSATGGFDKVGNPTIYLFREDQIPYQYHTFVGGNWWGISAINNTPSYNYNVSGQVASGVYNLPAGNGYLLFFRGDKALGSLAAQTTVGAAATAATLTASGTLIQGQVVVHDWQTASSQYLAYTGSGTGTNATVRGYTLVGNPYASSIDWEQMNTSTSNSGIYTQNVDATIYELNPVTLNYDSYQLGGVSTNHGSRVIVSGESFFVKALSNSQPQLIFNESAKVTTQNTGLDLFMSTDKAGIASARTALHPHLHVQMYMDSVYTDDTYIGLSPSFKDQYVEREDALHFAGAGRIGIASLSSDSAELAINKRSWPGTRRSSIPLMVSAAVKATYKLNLTEQEGIPKIYNIWLKDNYKKDSVNFRQDTSYAFEINSDALSSGNKRFELVFNQDTALALKLISFSGTKAAGGSLLHWTVKNEQSYTHFTLERSIDNGASYQIIGGFPSTGSGSYDLLDHNPGPSSNMYRLKLEDLNGMVTYSGIVTLLYGKGSDLAKSPIILYPNPASNIIHLNIDTQAAVTTGLRADISPVSTMYGIKIISQKGEVVRSATITQSEWETNVSSLPPGTYIFQVTDKNQNLFIGRTTFVKL